jgi:hypothetical protein
MAKIGKRHQELAMLLTANEYRRGVVKWAADTDATLAVVTFDGGRRITSSRMTEPAGSVPDIEPGDIVQMNMLANDPDTPLDYYRLSWDRCLRDEIVTILNGGPAGEAMLTGIPALGRFERLMLAVPYLQWDDGWVVRVGDVAVRFTNVLQFEGFSTDSVEHRGRESTVIQTFSTRQIEGSFIEIVAPETMSDRHEIAFAIVGLLALVFGEIAIGDNVHRDVLISTPAGTEYAVTTPLHSIPSAPNLALRMPIQPPIEWMQDFDRLLTRFVDVTDVRTDTALALRWYERAARTGGNVDKFLAAFVGLESLIGALGRRVGVESPIADLLRDPRVGALDAGPR